MRKTVIAALLVCSVTAAAAYAAATSTGPSSSASPYVVPSQPGVQTRSILTVGDAVDGYRMVGIPDGLGAFKSGHGRFTLLMNHELASNRGTVRAHGAIGAFVSRWELAKHDLEVVAGGDQIQAVALWNPGTGSYAPPAKGVALGRLCSADLPGGSAVYDRRSHLGFDGPLLLDGEEVAKNE